MAAFDIDAVALEASQDEPPSRVRDVSRGNHDTEMQKTLHDTIKLCLSNRQAIKVVQAILIWCFQLQTEDVFGKAAQQSTKRYEAAMSAAKEKGSIASHAEMKENIGMPAVQVFLALVKTAIKEPLPVGFATTKETMALFEESMKLWIGKNVLDNVPHCKISRVSQKENKKFEMCILREKYMVYVDNPENVISITWAAMMIKKRLSYQDGFKLMHGMLPKGELERRLQAYFDSSQ